MLSVGIIGLPNVGKSTLFNALTSGQADVSNYSFTTIDSNVGVVAVPDPRLDRLADLLEPEEVRPSFIQFTDIAGLVRGASRGEGLGNQFLASIRDVDAIAHVVRCFSDPNVSHVLGSVDAARDIDIIETELLLADLEVMQRAIEKRQRIWKTNPRQYADEKRQFQIYFDELSAGVPLRRLEKADQAALKGLGLLTGKPILYVANVSEDEPDDGECIQQIRSSRLGDSAQVVSVAASLESELQTLPEDERKEFRKELNLHRTGLERLVEEAFQLLNLIRFYTIVNDRLRAWTIRVGSTAPEAAGQVHSDMQSGFIRAQVASFEDFIEQGSFANLHRTGLLRTEGKEYQVQDGDIIEFLFN